MQGKAVKIVNEATGIFEDFSDIKSPIFATISTDVVNTATHFSDMEYSCTLFTCYTIIFPSEIFKALKST